MVIEKFSESKQEIPFKNIESRQFKEVISQHQEAHRDLSNKISSTENLLREKQNEYNLLEQSAKKNKRNNRLIFIKDDANIDKEMHVRIFQISHIPHSIRMRLS